MARSLADIVAKEDRNDRGLIEERARLLLGGMKSQGVTPRKAEVGFLRIKQSEPEGDKFTLLFASFPRTVPYVSVDHKKKKEIIHEGIYRWVTENTCSISSEIQYREENARMILEIPGTQMPYSLTIVASSKMRLDSPLLLEQLPFVPFEIGVVYSSLKDPLAAELLDGIAGSRIPAFRISGHPYLNRSKVVGHGTRNRLDMHITLYLQDEDRENYLRCYEVELFTRKNKNPGFTTAVVPESEWQPEENHYCMIDTGSFPLIPADLARVATLKMSINYDGSSKEGMRDLVGNFPLSASGKNQWYAKFHDRTGTLTVMHSPAWKMANTFFVYERELPGAAVSYINRAVDKTVQLKSALESITA